MNLKRMLGATTKTSLGSHVKVLLESRVYVRTGSRFLEKVAVLRARILCLPSDHPAALAVSVAEKLGVETWWEHTRSVMEIMGVEKEIFEVGLVSEAVKADSTGRKRAVSKYKHDFIRPRMLAMEREWFGEAIQKIYADELAPHSWSKPVSFWAPCLCWQGWGRTMWRFHKAWCVARITHSLPLAWFGGIGLVPVLAH